MLAGYSVRAGDLLAAVDRTRGSPAQNDAYSAAVWKSLPARDHCLSVTPSPTTVALQQNP